MESFDLQIPEDFTCGETVNQIPEQVSAMEEDESKESLSDLMICDSSSILVPKGLTKDNCTDQVVVFVNAGAKTSVEWDSRMNFLADNFFQGGDVFQTEEDIADGGDFPFIYQSARSGNFTYAIDNIPPGDYFVDLHFVEIIHIQGPKGMRIFNVFMQDEKVLSDFDIFAIVGANKPLQLVDSRVSVEEGGALVIKFEGINGSPVVSGICVRRAFNVVAGSGFKCEYLTCSNCASNIEIPTAQMKVMRMKSIPNYEKKIQELSELLQRKTDECYQSWMSWAAANKQLEKVKMELDIKIYESLSLDETLRKQAEKLKDVSSSYENDKRFWVAAIDNLEAKVQVMKNEYIQLSHEAHDCAGSIPELNKMVFAVKVLVEEREDLKLKYNEEQMKRRKLYNQVQEAKGNIRVFCRCRPLNKTEVLAGCSTVVDFDAAKDGELAILNAGSTKKIFKFDCVYTPKDDQVDVFADASPIVISVLDGYNVCIFAYGQTGTGKTFTMEGIEENRGVNYRTLEELFKIAKERSETFVYNISVSVLEVYNEQIRDLLATSSSSSKKLEIKQAEGCHHIPGIVEAEVQNIKEVWNVLQAGSSVRAVGSNNVNEHSSRSHCMLCVMVKAKNLISGECTKSKLWLVDLAGSERLAKTDVQGDRLKEAQNINRSLSALGDVISALANKSSHIPYRNSKLTHLLQDSLGGDSKTLMFVQISPSDKDLSETISSLNFATRVRGIELGPARKQIDTTEFQKMKLMVDKVKQECRTKEESIRKLEESLQNIESKARGRDVISKSQQDKIKDLENQLESKAFLHLQSEKEVSNLAERLKAREETCIILQEKVTELEKRLMEQGRFEAAAYEKKVKDLEIRLKGQVEESESRTIILQHKVQELEAKLKEKGHDSETNLLHQKVKDLEIRLKGQVEESESRTIILQHKVQELEAKLKQKGHDSETNLLHQKIKDLEEKLKEQEQKFTISSKCTPLEEGKRLTRDDAMNESEHHRILRSSNSLNRQASQNCSSLPKDDPVPVFRKKRLSRNGDIENNAMVPAIPTSDKRSRQSDPPLPPPSNRIAKTTKKPVKTSRDHPVQGIKERETKKRMWTR